MRPAAAAERKAAWWEKRRKAKHSSRRRGRRTTFSSIQTLVAGGSDALTGVVYKSESACVKNAAASAGVVDGRRRRRGVSRRRAAAQVLSARTVFAGRFGVQTRPVPRGLDAVGVRRRRQRRRPHEPVARGRRDDARLATRLSRRLAARPPAVQPGQPHVRAAASRRPVFAADDPRTERAALPAGRLLRRPPLGARLQRAVRRWRAQVLRPRRRLFAGTGKN